jgi:tetraacyldisaccharide 4'-kinase
VRAGLEQKLNAIWYGAERLPFWLKPLAAVYRAGQAADRARQLRQQPEDLRNASIVVVGNLTAGGAGKTPLVIRICELLGGAGLKAGVISRGYGRKGAGLLRVGPDSRPEDAGDEPVLIARRTGAPVIVDADRCKAARALLADGVDVVVSDDGLQHYRLPRSVEVCVLDGARGLGNGRLLPAGPLREPAQRLQSVDFVIVNGGEIDRFSIPGAVSMSLVPGRLRSLCGTQSWRLSEFAGCRVNAVAGIGNPERFFDTLRSARITVNEYAFPDHHEFTPADFESLEPELPVLMTEKDAVKASAFSLENAWYLEVDAALPREWETAFLARMMQEKS